ncbi:hypothetical protein [Streptomyces rhizosphaerihabitans]|uniref:hypothetical protein n=1 Tax=Streptomyces rhizosphaerihabitans TaxID=1266770 RepID=UPI0021BF72E9|nr:hypothetical protein [Streptomyces rhizosphaerihabitans]MCT9009399.1 hypothetical protein [Streptomyces rhizosphaerihabitans]
MNRPARPVEVALTASTVVLLTACGSGGGDGSSCDRQVHIDDGGSGVPFYRVDERGASTKNRRTGKVTTTSGKPESVLRYRARPDRTSQGVWKNVSLTTVAGGCG